VFNLLRSLLLTIVLSFSIPVLGIAGMLGVTSGVSAIPGLTSVGQVGTSQILGFLTIFGAGYPIQGALIVGSAWGMVGCLLELYNFYLFQDLRSH
jgi:hypothetical protein